MDEKTMTDILLICKGWYNKKKYKTVLDAMNAYYHKYYGNEDMTMAKGFALELFLYPLAKEIIKKCPNMINVVFCTLNFADPQNGSFIDTMYARICSLIFSVKQDVFDLAEYEEMFKAAKEKGYADTTIGII